MSRKESFKAKLARSAKATEYVFDMGNFPNSEWLQQFQDMQEEADPANKWNDLSEWERTQLMMPVVIRFINENPDCPWEDFYKELANNNEHTALKLFKRFNAPRVSNIYQHVLNKKDKQDSVWFDTNSGDWSIIDFVVDGRFSVSVSIVGDVKMDVYTVKKDKNGKPVKVKGEFVRKYKNSVSTPDEASINNDKQLQKAIENGEVEWSNNNWFTYSVYDNKTKEYLEVNDAILDNLDQCFDFKYPIEFIDDYKKELDQQKEESRTRG